LRVKILGVHSAEEQGGERPIRPMDTMMARAEMAPGVPTPIESGTVEVRANVLVTFLIGAM
ncbi:MAG TPA: SIMPL domain-containing protein, partial [Bryobacteraceae bacterium]|nr:SIMPL domain-containing protein [Bryobacteraceae bacterium]